MRVGSLYTSFPSKRLEVNRWVSTRFNLLSASVVGVTAVVIMLTPSIDAALAGFALAVVSTVTNDVCGRSVKFADC